MHSLIQIDLARPRAQEKPRRTSARRGQPQADRSHLLRLRLRRQRCSAKGAIGICRIFAEGGTF